MGFLVIFIQKAIGQGIGILYGALGEIMTEKSGNLNLGIPGMMYMGGIAGLIGAFLYENGTANPNGLVGLLISFVCAFVCAALGGLVYSVLTITLRGQPERDRSCPYHLWGWLRQLLRRFPGKAGRGSGTDFRGSDRRCL